MNESIKCISSNTTYLLPIILLLIPGYYISFVCFERVSIPFLPSTFNMYILSPILLSLLFFGSFRLLVKSAALKYLKFSIFFWPYLVSKIIVYFTESRFDEFGIIGGLFFGGILYLSFNEFLYRYMATLRHDSLHFKNWLGCTETVNLSDIVKLEQKFNLLGFIREFRFLNFAKKTIVTYSENYFQYDIKFFARVGKGDKIFSNIVENARQGGNNKIRLYGY